MPAGRPPKPTNLKLLEGDRESRINREEPIPGQGEIRPPVTLSDAAAEVWGRLAPDRIAKGLLTGWDVDAFALFCESVAMAHKLTSGALGPAEFGKGSPMTRFKDAVTLAGQLGARFGWTPSDRAKLTTKGEDDGQGAARLLG